MSDLAELLKAAFQYQIHEVYTAIPCVIINIVNIGEQRVDVQPLLNNIRPDGTDVPHPALLSVPLIFPATNTSALTFEVNNGDTVLCIFSQRCTDSFKSGNGKAARPLDLRIYDKRDACALIGMFPFSKAANKPNKRTWEHDTKDTVLVHNIGTSNEVEIRLKKDGNLIINTNKNVTVNCEEAEVNATTTTVNGEAIVNGDLTVNGDIDSTGTITATTNVIGGGKSLIAHTHTAGTYKAGPTNVTLISGPPV